MKTELFENADFTASIYYVSEHVHGNLGIARGGLCLFSFIEVRTSKLHVTASLCRRGSFRKLSLSGRGYFYTDKKDAFSKISGYVWTRPEKVHSEAPFLAAIATQTVK